MDRKNIEQQKLIAKTKFKKTIKRVALSILGGLPIIIAVGIWLQNKVSNISLISIFVVIWLIIVFSVEGIASHIADKPTPPTEDVFK